MKITCSIMKQIHSFLKAWCISFCSVSACLEESLFQSQNMLRIYLHIEKRPLTASCSKALLFLSMEADVPAWRFLMSSLAKNIWRGLKQVIFSQKCFYYLNLVYILFYFLLFRSLFCLVECMLSTYLILRAFSAWVCL